MPAQRDLDLVVLDDCLRDLAEMSDQQTAAVLGISPATVKRNWAVARAWLFRELRGQS